MATWNKTDTETKEEIAQQEQKDKCECSSKIKSLENFLTQSGFGLKIQDNEWNLIING